MRFGLIGTSGHAEAIAATALTVSPLVELVGAVGSTASRSQAFASRHGTRAYGSLAEMLDEPAVEAVWIASPNHLHADHGVACLQAGKHVLMEKPMAVTVSEASRLVRAARRRRLELRVSFHQRFRPAHQMLGAAVRSGDFGELCFVRAQRFFPYPELPAPWRRSAAESGGWAINDVGSHLLDLILWLAGSHAKVAGAVLATQRFAVDSDDAAALLLRLGHKGIGVLEASTALDGASSRVELYGTAGWARAEGTWTGGGYVELSSGGRLEPEPAAPLDPFVAQLADFVAATKGEPSIGADGEAGAANVTLIAQARARADGSTRIPASARRT